MVGAGQYGDGETSPGGGKVRWARRNVAIGALVSELLGVAPGAAQRRTIRSATS